MKRLIEKIVFSGFVIALRLATWPTRISPSFVKAATEGVSRLPSWFGITVGLPPSTTATTELVVPRSIPITFAMFKSPLSSSCENDVGSASRRARTDAGGAERALRTARTRPETSARDARSQHVDLDFSCAD